VFWNFWAERKFSVFEILQIAERIERNAAMFYQKSAALFEDAQLRATLYRLAEWESKHEELFRKTRTEYTQKLDILGTFNPDNYELCNPQEIVGLAESATKADKGGVLTGKENKRKILQTALKMEKDGIAFYRRIRRRVRDLAGKETMKDIVAEERRHIKILEQSLEQL